MKFEVLYKSPLFNGLTEKETDDIIGSINYRVRSYPAGAVAALLKKKVLLKIIQRKRSY